MANRELSRMAIIQVLTQHHFSYVNHSSIGSADHCRCGYRPVGIQQWREHTAPLIAEALAPQPKPAVMETGHDMGARLDGASQLFPQHTKPQK
jgi:hypothetical protein